MKKINVSAYSFHRLGDNYQSACKVEEVEGEIKQSPSDSIVRLVYAPDSRTGLPTGDLNYLVSDKANPQVKEFIKTQLMMDTSAAKNVTAKFDLSDEDVLSLSRNTGESLDDYVARLNTSIERDKWLIQQSKNVSSESKSAALPAE